ncbi:MAG: hypothetical protein SYNGOMJ08_00340 [Candidatus Syntrophoarchaeum sp. GoM_oil]|nr:MAG: hypothetical protein SYNGOMJ08_00340 [Candidatus Syntrophoarchaeum sp. GoM_oil]
MEIVINMGLIVENSIRSSLLLQPENAANAYLAVPSKYLSEAYELPEGSVITGEILGIMDLMGRGVEEAKNLINSTIIFVIMKVLGTDYLYISRDSWPLLREYGILPDDYKLRVKIISARVNEEEIKVYPKIEKVA